MAIGTAITTAFKQAMLAGNINVPSDTFKLALYNSTANIDETTGAYTTAGEVTGTNYTAGGNTLTGGTVWTDGTTVGITFTNVTFSNVTINGIQGFMIYDSTRGNVSVMTFNLGQQFNPLSEPFIIQFPAGTANAGMIQFP